MPYPFGVTPPCWDKEHQCGGCFDGFNVFAMEEEGLFADHPDEVKALAEQLRQDPEAAEQFIEEANAGTEISVNGVLLTRNDLEQINLLLDKFEVVHAWMVGHGGWGSHNCLC